MSDAKLYYTAPPEEAFDDMKACALRIWGGYDDPYRTEKIDRIAHITNVGDNFCYIFAMFDPNNMRKVVAMLQESTKDELRARMIDGGNDEWYINSLGL